MAEHVAEASAPSSLVTDVRRRHRRRVTRIRTTVGVAAAAVVAIAALPAADFFDIGAAAPVGAPTTASKGPAAPPPGSQQPLGPGTPDPRTSSGEPRAGATVKPSATPPHRRGGPSGGVIPPVVDWLAYLPSGLRAVGPCADERSETRRTIICRWTGPAGTLEVRLHSGSGLTKPEDVFALSAVPKYTSVRGQRAITLERTLAGGAGSLVMWIDHPGSGVTVSVSPSLRTQLMRIAEGVHAPS
ncbi:hypothetical protein [Actinomadura sp. HBU206391]|uniref:hypothetical protein n=1 Tax=Actinomadura sp. HBU206391 TaxID=2731692 RepID=UPI00164F2CAB|nr:hypothetical protein [Actinomadura sp. HBU206391]MBC6459506.1 hypothetical protein [Actinomadura sp. HBU206391]